MDENTKKFAEKEIVNLISNANYNNKEEKNHLKFNLVFCGDFADLPNDMGSPIDFIMKNKERIQRGERGETVRGDEAGEREAGEREAGR